MNLSLHQTLLMFLLYVRQTGMTQLIPAISLLEVIRKDSSIHMHGLAVKEGLLFARDLSLENSADSQTLALLHSVSHFFSSINHLLHLCARFLILFHLT